MFRHNRTGITDINDLNMTAMTESVTGLGYSKGGGTDRPSENTDNSPIGQRIGFGYYVNGQNNQLFRINAYRRSVLCEQSTGCLTHYECPRSVVRNSECPIGWIPVLWDASVGRIQTVCSFGQIYHIVSGKPVIRNRMNRYVLRAGFRAQHQLAAQNGDICEFRKVKSDPVR